MPYDIYTSRTHTQASQVSREERFQLLMINLRERLSFWFEFFLLHSRPGSLTPNKPITCKSLSLVYARSRRERDVVKFTPKDSEASSPSMRGSGFQIQGCPLLIPQIKGACFKRKYRSEQTLRSMNLVVFMS